MRTPRTLLVAALLFTGFVSSTSSRAAWGPDGSTVKATTSSIPKISATGDGGQGTIVVWQEESTPGTGVLRALHVLATGDPDPAWPAGGTLLCGVSAARPAIGALSDGLGGAYAWWKQGSALFLTRVDASGAVAAGWPANGRSLGTTSPGTALPSVIEDGANGVYATWPAASFATDPMSILAIHLGPANTGAGGWPNSIKTVAGGDPVATLDYWPRLALAPDGGIFVTWASSSADPDAVSSAYRLRRLSSAGANASGWPIEGLELGTFHGEWLDSNPETGLVGLSPDGRGGIFAVLGLLTGFDGYQVSVETRLFRLQGDGQSAIDWPAAGAIMSNGPNTYEDAGPDASWRVSSDRVDGAHVGVPLFNVHGYAFGFRGVAPDGNFANWFEASGDIQGQESVNKRDGGIFLATFFPSGPSGPYQPYANLRVTQSNAPAGWSDFYEYHDNPVISWYGDIALAPAGDAGAVFFWSQGHDRFGLFARRFNSTGEVNGVPGGNSSATLALSRLRFVPGEGVRASLSLAGADARLDLFDVAGRRVAASRLAGLGAGAREVTLPGTADLASGLYFARLLDLRESRSGKVIVSR